MIECDKCHKQFKKVADKKRHFKKIHQKTVLGDNRRQAFLLTFFDSEQAYTEKEINGFWLVKSYNRDSDTWQVGIYTQDSFRKYKNFSSKQHNSIQQGSV